MNVSRPRSLFAAAPEKLRHGHMRHLLAHAGTTAADHRQFLQDFTKREFRGAAQQLLDSREKRDLLRQAVLAVASEPWPEAGYSPNAQPPQVLIGVLASEVRLAVRSLRDYCAALSLPYSTPTSRTAGVSSLASMQGPVFIKYSAASGSAQASSYAGRDRGVLLTLGQEQVGHLPLGLWDEEMRAAPPSL